MTINSHPRFRGRLRFLQSGLSPSVENGGNAQILLRMIREQSLRYWKTYAASFFLMAVLAGCVTATAYFIGTVVNATTLERDFHRVLLICGVIIAIFLVKGLVQYGQSILLTRAHTNMTASYQSLLFDRLLFESMDHLSSVHSSEIMNRLRISAEAPAKAMDITICAIGREGLSVLGLVAIMIYQDPLLSLGCLLSTPIIVALARSSRVRLDDLTLMSIKAQNRTSEILQETLNGMRLIKTFGLEQSIRDRAHDRIESVRETDQKIAQLTWRYIPWVEALSGCTVAMIILYGSYRIISLGATPGNLVSFLTAFMLAYEPVKRLARFPVDVSNALAATRLLYETLDSEPSEPSDTGKSELVVSKGRIVLHDVKFGYQDDLAVLRGLSLTAEPGQVTALVGHSGSGKSTIFNLLLRLYESHDGTITIDNQNIADVQRNSVRRSIAYLGQDTFLFHGTIGENIAVGRLGASRAHIVAAAQAAHADDFIMSFPRGYDTPVGENGLALSNGQRQRIAIARAFLKNAPIVLLDEPTASLDTISEREVQRAISRLCRDRTTLVIAHRMHTIVNASAIYVVGGGEILEYGDHSSLLKRGAAYRALQAGAGGEAFMQEISGGRSTPAAEEPVLQEFGAMDRF
jgi:subfamily B ATP-binding cassette protein MsbA